MTKPEYSLSGCENYHSKFTFVGDKDEFGVITTFFPNEPDNYYLVRSPNMIEFKKYMDSNDHKRMKGLCALIDLKDLIKAERIYPAHNKGS